MTTPVRVTRTKRTRLSRKIGVDRRMAPGVTSSPTRRIAGTRPTTRVRAKRPRRHAAPHSRRRWLGARVTHTALRHPVWTRLAVDWDDFGRGYWGEGALGSCATRKGRGGRCCPSPFDRSREVYPHGAPSRDSHSVAGQQRRWSAPDLVWGLHRDTTVLVVASFVICGNGRPGGVLSRRMTANFWGPTWP